MAEDPANPYTLPILDIHTCPEEDGYLPVKLVTERGDLEFRYYRAPQAKLAAIWVGGVGGGWDTPARGLYPRLCGELVNEDISSLRIRFRNPQHLREAVLDAIAGFTYLTQDGIKAISATGHSFGGAVVIQAAALCQDVRTVVTLSTQSYGAAPISQLAPRCSILSIHGTADRVLPPSCSEHVYRLAGEPKKLILFPGAGHNLDEAATEVHQTVHNWVVAQLGAVSH